MLNCSRFPKFSSDRIL